MYWIDNKEFKEESHWRNRIPIINDYRKLTLKDVENAVSILYSNKIEENNKINNEMTEVLYVKLTDVPKTDTRKDFIRKFIRGKFASYSNEDCTKLQCESGRFRSITELHQIVLSRFPKTSFEAIIRIVRDLINEENPFTMVYCTTVEKVVLKYLGKATSSYISDYSRSNYYTVKGTDGYSLSDYEQLINKI